MLCALMLNRVENSLLFGSSTTNSGIFMAELQKFFIKFSKCNVEVNLLFDVMDNFDVLIQRLNAKTF